MRWQAALCLVTSRGAMLVDRPVGPGSWPASQDRDPSSQGRGRVDARKPESGNRHLCTMGGVNGTRVHIAACS